MEDDLFTLSKDEFCAIYGTTSEEYELLIKKTQEV